MDHAMGVNAEDVEGRGEILEDEAAVLEEREQPEVDQQRPREPRALDRAGLGAVHPVRGREVKTGADDEEQYKRRVPRRIKEIAGDEKDGLP